MDSDAALASGVPGRDTESAEGRASSASPEAREVRQQHGYRVLAQRIVGAAWSFPAAIVVVIAARGLYESHPLTCVVGLLGSTITASLRWAMNRRAQVTDITPRWVQLFWAGTIAAAVWWQLVAVTVTARPDVVATMPIELVITLVVAYGGGQTYAADKRLGRLWAALMLLPAAAALAWHGGEVERWLAVFFCVAFYYSWRQSSIAHDDFWRLFNARELAESRASELDAARRSAEAANQAKSELIARLSHELRTPLVGVLGTAELLRETPLERTQVEYVEAMADSGNILLRLVNDILDASRLERSELELRQEPLELVDCVRQAVRALLPLARSKNLELHMQTPEGPIWLRGDHVRLSQVVNNVVGNAIKFTDRGSIEVTLAVSDADPSLVAADLTVRDSGIGIPEGQLERLFEPYFQVSPSSTRRFPGSGLGLSIVKHLALAMGGDVEAKSTLGVGTTFRVSLVLPAAACLEHEAPTTAPVSEPVDVLIVDDNAVNRLVVSAMLEHLGHRITALDNGAAAVAILAQQDFALVLMDCHMPDMDGYEATQRIRGATHERRTVPIVALTADAGEVSVRRAQAAGMNTLIAKPVTSHQLAEVLASLVDSDRDSTR